MTEDVVFLKTPASLPALAGKLMVAMMNVGHSAVARWGFNFGACAGCQSAGLRLRRRCEHEKTAEKMPAGGIVKGIDYSPVSVERRKKVNETAIAEGRCAVLQGSVADMIFADDWFDAVTAFETVYFWPFQKREMSKMYRGKVNIRR